ncbi:hypothetical protein C5167_032032 [Papaver somniferum]|uniref:RRM domain-containing protein n=2 Tax=Papaver somniferum TaxID=3469 RepID=A0A4Y7K7Z6_PAPSO|nr:hypothetical protein C5167_032032 [Papaver somniferum]
MFVSVGGEGGSEIETLVEYMSEPVEYRCFIGGLSWSTSDRGLKSAFEKYGNLVEAKHALTWADVFLSPIVFLIETLVVTLMRINSKGAYCVTQVVVDKFSGRSRGFGFVTFDDKKAMDEAIDAMNGMDLDGRPITVDKAQPHQGSGRDRDGDLAMGRIGMGIGMEIVMETVTEIVKIVMVAAGMVGVVAGLTATEVLATVLVRMSVVALEATVADNMIIRLIFDGALYAFDCSVCIHGEDCPCSCRLVTSCFPLQRSKLVTKFGQLLLTTSFPVAGDMICTVAHGLQCCYFLLITLLLQLVGYCSPRSNYHGENRRVLPVLMKNENRRVLPGSLVCTSRGYMAMHFLFQLYRKHQYGAYIRTLKFETVKRDTNRRVYPFNLERENKTSEKMEVVDEGIDKLLEDSKDLQQQNKAFDKLTDLAQERTLNLSRAQEAVASIAASSEADLNARKLREKELAAVKVNAGHIDIIANELEIDKKVAERTLREHKGDAVAAIRHLLR